MGNTNLNILERNAKIIVLFAIFAASTSGVIGKMIEAPSMVIAFYRLLFALPFFIIPVILNSREEVKTLSKKSIMLSACAGFFLFIHYWSWFTAVRATAIASATVLMSLHPFFVVIMSIFIWKKKVSLKAIIGITIAIIGGIIVVGGNFTGGNTLYGDIMGLIAGLGFGIYLSIGSEVRKNVSAAVYISMVFGICFICFAITIIITSTPIIGYDSSDYLWIALMAILCQLGAHAVFNWSMGYVSSLYVSTFDTGEIVIATILALILFAEIPTMFQIIGGIIVIIGLLYYNFHEKD